MRFFNPKGNTSKASHSHKKSSFKHVNAPNHSSISFKA
jgi:hypothetical protein